MVDPLRELRGVTAAIEAGRADAVGDRGDDFETYPAPEYRDRKKAWTPRSSRSCWSPGKSTGMQAS